MSPPFPLLAAFASLALGACFLAPAGPTRRGPPAMGEPVRVPPSNPAAIQARGRVLDARGLPVAGLEVLVVGGGHTGSRVRTDAGGGFTVAGLPATDDALVIVGDSRFAPLVREGVKLREREPASVSLRLEPALAIAGRVLDERGEPLARAQLSVRGERKLLGRVRRGASVESVAGVDRVETDGDGRFRFAGLYAGEFELVARWPFASACSASARVRAGDEAVALRFDAATVGRAFVVGVVSGPDGVPSAGADVCARATADESAAPVCATARTDGTFVLGPLEPGEHGLSASSRGAGVWNGQRAFPAGITRLEIALGGSR